MRREKLPSEHATWRLLCGESKAARYFQGREISVKPDRLIKRILDSSDFSDGIEDIAARVILPRSERVSHPPGHRPVPPAILAPHQGVGLIVADDPLLGGVELQRAPDTRGDVPQVAQRR